MNLKPVLAALVIVTAALPLVASERAALTFTDQWAYSVYVSNAYADGDFCAMGGCGAMLWIISVPGVLYLVADAPHAELDHAFGQVHKNNADTYTRHWSTAGYRDNFVHEAHCDGGGFGWGSGVTASHGLITWGTPDTGLISTPVDTCGWIWMDQNIPPETSGAGSCVTAPYWNIYVTGATAAQLPVADGHEQELQDLSSDTIVRVQGYPNEEFNGQCAWERIY